MIAIRTRLASSASWNLGSEDGYSGFGRHALHAHHHIFGLCVGEVTEDTGTPALVLPPDVFEAAAALIDFGEPASLTFYLPGASGEQEVPVSFDLIALNNRAALSKGGVGTNIILGLPPLGLLLHRLRHH